MHLGFFLRFTGRRLFFLQTQYGYHIHNNYIARHKQDLLQSNHNKVLSIYSSYSYIKFKSLEPRFVTRCFHLIFKQLFTSKFLGSRTFALEISSYMTTSILQ